MNPERWRQIETVFAAVSDLAAAEREAYLEEACRGDADLRYEVESLLAAEALPLTMGAEIAETVKTLAAQDPLRNQRLGPYRILGELGHGGMGSVFEAVRDDDEYQKTVAIKIIRANLANTQLEARFRAERQILAQLEHPYIARLIDGGSHEGLPYIVMEYVQGQPIDVYCREQKLPIRERMVLFRKVCEAVQHAHQRLIVHRDLKPSNVLVLNDGTPRLLDFGIAKLLDQETNLDGQLTQTGWLLMTPDYASPEQVRGEAITAASDVYSLAIILYELLTGERPYKLKNYSPSEIQSLVCTGEVAAPSSRVTQASKLRRQLAGDLDNVLLMALRKEPARRYQSVEKFSEDIRRHLDGETVTARRDTFGYRSGKFIRRNRMAVTLATFLLTSILAGAFFTYREGLRAQQRFSQVRAIANRVLTEFEPEASKLAGSTKLRAAMSRASMEYLDSLRAEAVGDPKLQAEVGLAYIRVGDTLGYPRIANLGLPFEAALAYEKALALVEPLQAKSPNDPERRRLLSTVYSHYASLMPRLGKSDKAEPYYRRALQLAEGADAKTGIDARFAFARHLFMNGELTEAAAIADAGADAAYRSNQMGSAMAFLQLSSEVHGYLGDPERALKSIEEGLRIFRSQQASGELLPVSFRNPAAVHFLEKANRLYSSDTPSLNMPCEAAEAAKQSLAMLRQLNSASDPDNSNRISVIGTLHVIAVANAECRPGSSEAVFAEAREVYKQVKLDAEDVRADEAVDLMRRNKLKEAWKLVEPSLDRAEAHGLTLLIGGELQLAFGRPAQAIAYLEPAWNLYRKQGASKVFDAIIYRYQSLKFAVPLGEAYLRLNRRADALRVWRQALVDSDLVAPGKPIAPTTLKLKNTLASKLAALTP